MTIVKRLLLAALAASLLLASEVEAKPPKQQTKERYTKLWYKVRHEVSQRAPGRNIRRYGVRYDAKHNGERGPWKTRDARHGEMRKSIKQLKRLLHPPSSPLLETQGGPPPQEPAGVMTPTQRAPAGGTLAAIRACESGGNYSTNTGNGFYGAYQFDMQTWQSVGGSGNPAYASPAEQDKRAAILYAQRGASPWPVCGQ